MEGKLGETKNKLGNKINTLTKWVAVSTVALSTTTQSLLEKYTPKLLEIYLAKREDALSLLPESKKAITTVLDKTLAENYELCMKVLNSEPKNDGVGFAIRGPNEIIHLIETVRENITLLTPAAKESLCTDANEFLEMMEINKMIPNIVDSLNAGFQSAATEVRMIGLTALVYASVSEKLNTKMQRSDSLKDRIVAKIGSTSVTLLTAFIMNRIVEWAVTGGIANESLMADVRVGTMGIVAIAGSGILIDKITHGNKAATKTAEFLATLGVIYTKSEMAATIINPLLSLLAI